MKKIFFIACALLLPAFPINAAHLEDETRQINGTILSDLKEHPDETPEEILIRAYRGDSRAMVLATVGYATGLEGFPQNLYLTIAWSDVAYGLANLQTEALITLYVKELPEPTQEGVDSKIPDYFLARWEYALNSPGARILAEAGILNPETRIEELRRIVSADEWHSERYSEEKNKLLELSRQRNLVIKTIRDLRSREMTEDDVPILNSDDPARRMSDQALMRYVATDDEPGQGKPEWRLEYLNQFIAMRDRKKEPELAKRLADAARLEGQRLIFQIHERDYLLELLRRAHSGNTEAIREVAFAHRSGVLLKSESMYMQWLSFGAVHHRDVICMELLAENFANSIYYNPGLFVFPMRTEYLWAKLAMHYGDKETRGRMGKLLDLVEKKYTRSDVRSLDMAVAGLIKNMEAGKGLIWIK